MNIIKREWKAQFKSMIIWSVALIVLVSTAMVEYGSFADNPAINDFMKALPEGILGVIGMNNLSLSNLNSFIGMLALYLSLLLSIQATLLGGSIISKEETFKTAEFLFVKPISRKKVIIEKMVSAIVMISFLNVITFLAIIISTLNYEKGDDFNSFLLLLSVSIFIIQMVFLSIGMLIAAMSKHPKKSGNISVGILVVTFLIASLINIVESVDFLAIITPFKYFEASYILDEMRLKPFYLLLSTVIIIIGLGGTLVSYPKRDLSI